MKDVIEFLTANPIGFLGTVDNGRSRVRPFQFQFEEEGKLFFCTANNKDVFAQLQKNPFVEYTTSTQDYSKTVRISGEAKFCKDIKDKEKVINNNELIKSIYQTVDNPIFEVFYIENPTVNIFNFG